MKLVYRKSESTGKPLTIETTPTTVFIRKDIVKNEDVYTYQEAKLSLEEFNKYSSQVAALNAVKGINDSDNISQIVENGVDSSTNQLVIMEAMADLYDLIATLM